MDAVWRLICPSLNLRVYTVYSQNIVGKIIKLHGAGPNAAAALGRTLNACALASAGLKPNSNQSVSVKFSGDGPLKEVLVQADARGSIRGLVSNPTPEAAGGLDTVSFSKAIGAGVLTVTRDLSLKEPYASVTPILYGEVAADMSYFFTQSDQVPSAMVLALELNRQGEVAASGGVLVQTFPDTSPAAADTAAELVQNMPVSLGAMLTAGKDINAAASEILGGRELEIVSSQEIRLACRCSKEMLSAVLSGVQKDELQKMIDEDHGTEITCSFCKKSYIFNEDELRDILAQK